MIRFFKRLSIALVLLIVTIFTVLFFNKPPLLFGTPFSRAVYDTNGHLLRLTLSQDDKYRLFVPLAAISPQLIDATLLQEDQYFRWHKGINPAAIIKAGWQTYVLQKRRVGASTITMQLARIRFDINSKTWQGKIIQILRALQLEMHYNKNQLLEAYLNLAPYGNNIEGAGAASLIYFSKNVKNLTLPEALTLAVIPQNPIQRTPKQKNLKLIRDKLYSRWLTLHPEDIRFQATMRLPLQMQTASALPFFAPHFVNQVLNHAETNEKNIVTTLDLNLQLVLDRIVHQYLSRKKIFGVTNAAVLLIDSRDMTIKSMIGSANFFDTSISGQINGTDIKRSPGSTLKPFIYGLAIDQGLIHPDTVLKDVPRSFGKYNPENFDYDFVGPIHAKDALVLSRNIPAIYLADQLAHPNLYDVLQEAHIKHLKSESYYGLALVLGGAEVTMQELASLYAALANEGKWQPLVFRDDQHERKEIRLLSREASFLVLDMLKQTPYPAESEFIADKNIISWKTGTSSGFRDAWTMGVVGPYVLAVWVGNFDNTANHAFVGKNIAAPLFFNLVEGIKQEKRTIPPLDQNPRLLNLIQLPVCKASGMLPTRFCHDTELTWFIPGKSPIKSDTIYREIAIDKKTGLRTCVVDKNTEFKIYEFWPSDLLKIFKEAGIQRKTPPPFSDNCSMISENGLSPQITSPQNDLSYILRANSHTNETVPFTAITDADVSTLFWFVNNVFLGKRDRNQPYVWQLKPGKYVVRVVDDHGRSDIKDIEVKMEN